LPVRDPDSLAVVSTKYSGFQYSMSHPAYAYLRDHAASLDGLVAFRAQPLNVNTGAATDRVTGMLVSGNYFPVLGVEPAIGSAITADDDRIPVSGGARGLVAVVSHDFWMRRCCDDFRPDASI
jgi:putative ABC transport system permease protein